MERILSNEQNLCDTTFVIGPTKHKMHGIRSLLANMSPVFKAQLFGVFREAAKGEVVSYPTVSVEVFKCILRTSLGFVFCVIFPVEI